MKLLVGASAALGIGAAGRAEAQPAAPAACDATAVNAVSQVGDWRRQQQADAARFCPNMDATDLARYTALRAAVTGALSANHCTMADVGLTGVETVSDIPCKPFDLDSLPPAADLLQAESAEGKVEFFGTTVPQAFRGLATNGDIRSNTPAVTAEFPAAGKAAFEEFVPPGGSTMVRDKMYKWYRDMGFTPAVATPIPTTPWTCPAPAAGAIDKCVGYEAALIASVRPVINRINTTTARAAVAASPGVTAVPAYPGDAARSAAILAEATAMDPTGAPAPASGVAPTAPRYPENQRVLMITAAYQILAPKYQAFYKAEVDGREALASLSVDDDGLQPLVDQEVTFFRWGSEAVKGRVTSVTLPVVVSPGPPAVAAVPATIVIQPEGTPAPAPVTLTATEINGTPATTGAAPTAAATPASARVFVDWPEEWKKARDVTIYHGRVRVNPVHSIANLTVFIGREVQVVNSDGTSSVEVLEAADVTSVPPTYTLRGMSAVNFNPHRTIFFVGLEAGSGAAVSLPEGLSLGVTGLVFAGKGNGLNVAGAGGGVTANLPLNRNVDVDGMLGHAGHDSSSGQATDRGANPSAPVALAALKLHVPVGSRKIGLKAGGGIVAEGGAVTAGLYAATGEENQFEANLGWMRLFGARATREDRLGNPMQDRFNAHTAFLTLTYRRQIVRTQHR